MRIGVPREIKSHENRISLRPAGAELLVQDGHEVWVERDAGRGSGFLDEEYERAGARVVEGAAEIWGAADMIVKVKEPVAEEYPLMRAGQTIFTYFHFAASEELTRAVLDSGAVALAYETVQEADGSLPLLIPMSEVAGRMAIQEGAKYLEKFFGGRGVLLGGVPGTPRGEVLVIGGGIVGINAAKMAAGMNAHVTILDINLERLRYLDDVMPANVSTLFSDPQAIREGIRIADLVVGAVLVTGAKAPRLVKRTDLPTMQEGSVIVDVAVDQGGCIETTRPTTHEDPTYVIDGVIHYCVANMPGGVPRTSTIALTNATFPYARRLARHGWREACRRDPALRRGLNVIEGTVTYPGVAEAFELEHAEAESLL